MVNRQNFQEALEKAIPTLRGYEQSSHERSDTIDTVFKATAYFDNGYRFNVHFMPTAQAYQVTIGKYRIVKDPDGDIFQPIKKQSKLVTKMYSSIPSHIRSFDFSSNDFVFFYGQTYISYLIFLSHLVSKL
jgi:hypothetical protein